MKCPFSSLAHRSTLPYRTHDHGDFDAEWSRHRGVSEWWYATGMVKDPDGHQFSFQFTVLSVRLNAVLRPKILMLALTDLEGKQHYYTQVPSVLDVELSVDDTSVKWHNRAEATKTPSGIRLKAQAKDFAYDFMMDYGKGAVWHCDNGVLQMGLPDEKETTLYFSYTNMPTVGTLTLGGTNYLVTGQSWFDKQGGTFAILNHKTHWEWFSFRFFDGEEIMLFSFPQSNRQDGTFIAKDGARSRLTDYTITPNGFTHANNMRFSNGWDIHIPGIKDEDYRLTPLMEGQLNFSYFEQITAVYTTDGTQVGVCFVELLPGVLNTKIGSADMFRRIGV